MLFISRRTPREPPPAIPPRPLFLSDRSTRARELLAEGDRVAAECATAIKRLLQRGKHER